MLTFRAFKNSDLGLYCEWKSQPEIWEVDDTSDYVKISPKDLRKWFIGIVDSGNSYIILLKELPIGYIGFKHINDEEKTAEFTIVLGEISIWGMGYGKAAMHWLFDQAFNNRKLTSLHGYVLGNNERALRFYKSLGFEIEGEHGKPYWRKGEKYHLIRISKHTPAISAGQVLDAE